MSDFPYYASVMQQMHSAVAPLLSKLPDGTALINLPTQEELWKLHAAFTRLDRAVEYTRATPTPHPSVSEGSVVEVTKAMREAGLEAAGICIRETSKAGNVRMVSVSDLDCEAIFLAMLAAAPQPTTKKG